MMTRRDFVAKLVAAGAALGAISIVPGAGWARSSSDVPRSGREVVSFHMDAPYIDRSGTATPYLPPCGACSAAHAARLDEEAFCRAHCYA
jgi:hypothetical protein